ncbi:MAG TPA: hypothetical protein VFF67_02380 [Thermoplasmata archaeon]|nr:hypothetical protein [Thermoplasmata archaeon]
MADARVETATKRGRWAVALGIALALSMAIVPGLAIAASATNGSVAGNRGGASLTPLIVIPTWSNVTHKASKPFVPAARNLATFAYYPPQRAVVLVDGYAGSTATALLADTYLYNASGRWVNATQNAGAPSARFAATMAYNRVPCPPALQSCLVLFGGASYVKSGANTVRLLLNDTWMYNGSWHNLSTSVRGSITGAPGPRFGATMAWDPALRGLLLFGGNNGGNLSDTWLFKETPTGGRWTQLTPHGTPVNARGPYNSLVFDSADREMVMIARGNETWTFANDTWTQLAVAPAPPAVTGRVLVDLPGVGVVLFGGYAQCYPSSTSCTASAHPFAFSGGNWTTYTTGAHPTPTQYPVAAYDPVFHAVVFFGTATLNAGGYSAQAGTWLFR